MLNPAGSGDSSTQSSVVPPPAVPGFTNPMPNQQFGGTVFIPELSGAAIRLIPLICTDPNLWFRGEYKQYVYPTAE